DPLRPYLDIMLRLDTPEPRLRTIIEAALDGKRPRLVQLRIEQTGSGYSLGDRAARNATIRRLAHLDRRDVFVQLWARAHAEPPSDTVIAAFDRLLLHVRGDAHDPAEPKISPQLSLGGLR